MMVFRAIATMLYIVATVCGAAAADIPVKAPRYPMAPPAIIAYYNWTGFYAGINGGFGWDRTAWRNPIVDTGSFDLSGPVLGGTVGYNYQVGSLLLGLEGDYDWSNIKGHTSGGPCAPTTCETSNTWLATFRGRIGYAYDRALFYFTGGVAWGNIRSTTPVGTDSVTNTGWTAGGGVEYGFSPSWSAKLEYLYYDLGKGSCGVACVLPSTPGPVDVAFHPVVVRAGLNYRFSGPIFSRD